jgi:hypothetical protein
MYADVAESIAKGINMNTIEAFKCLTHELEMYKSGDERYVFSYKESERSFGKPIMMFRDFCEKIDATHFISNRWEVRHKKKKMRKYKTAFNTGLGEIPTFAMSKLTQSGTQVTLEWEEEDNG